MEGEDKTGSFAGWQALCDEIGSEPSYTQKTKIVEKFFKSWKGDVYLACKLLLARDDKRVFNIREKAFAKILSKILDHPQCTASDILQDFEQGDMSATSKKFLELSGKARKKSVLTLKQVDDFLNELTTVTKDADQHRVISAIIAKCTADDLKWLWKLIDKDLKINIGPKFVLQALHPKGFDAYLKSNDLKLIIDRIVNHTLDEKLQDEKEEQKSKGKGFTADVSLMHPVKPMLARQCKSAEDIAERCPNGINAEIKYDGERIQIHKRGKEFNFFSRNLKTVLPWKVEPVKQFVSQATTANDIILDGEILLMDMQTHQPLPFGTLAIHKKDQFQAATVCVFLFDCLYFEGESLLHQPYEYRRKILMENVKTIPDRIEFSECHKFKPTETDKLNELLNKVMALGLEGLVVKDSLSTYDPNARHWNKIKKDYLKGMADTCDLIVLGAYFGTGRMGGLKSIFLMGVYDEKTQTFKTVCRVGNGHNDETIQELQTAIKWVKISGDPSKIPDWLDCDRTYTPDFVVADPKQSQVWEITGTEYTYSPKHSANAISVRFPRVKCIRDDKDWESATSLAELQKLVEVGEAVKRLLFKPVDVNSNNNNNQKNTANNNNNNNEDDVKSKNRRFLTMSDGSDELAVPPKEEKKKPIVQKTLGFKKVKYDEQQSSDSELETVQMSNEEIERIKAMSIPGYKQEENKNDNKNNNDEDDTIEMDVDQINNTNNKNLKRGFEGKPSKEEKPDEPKSKKQKGNDDGILPNNRAVKKIAIPKGHVTTELKLTNDVHPNHNEDITNILEQMGQYEKDMGHGVKHKAYMKAATALQLYPKRVTSGEEAKKLDGIGVKIAKKIDEILKTGQLAKLEKMKKDERLNAVSDLQKITGIGPAKAIELVDKHGIHSIEQLRKHTDLLNNHQQIGLKYHDEFQLRIPRDEIVEFEKMIQEVLPEVDEKLQMTICGSYRRQKATSGDIDILITHPDFTSDQKCPNFLEKLVKILTAKKILVANISLGKHQYHGVCRLPEAPDAKNRRMDILWIPHDQYYFGILYFTGSAFFNIQMRRIALEKGFTLNEQSILPIGITGVTGDPVLVNSEKEIFELLGMEYKDPPERDLAPSWKPTMS